jgi:hypothetical protein
MYAEETAAGGVGAIQTGFAIANTGSDPANVTLSLTNLDGSATGQPAVQRTIPGNGQIAGFLHEVFTGLQFPFGASCESRRLPGQYPWSAFVEGITVAAIF